MERRCNASLPREFKPTDLLTPALSSRGGEGEDSSEFVGLMASAVAFCFVRKAKTGGGGFRENRAADDVPLSAALLGFARLASARGRFTTWP